MEVYRPKLITAGHLTRYHSDDYVNFLRTITPGTCMSHLRIVLDSHNAVYVDNMGEYSRQLQRFNVGEDCPVFDGLFEFCKLYTSGSIGNSATAIVSMRTVHGVAP